MAREIYQGNSPAGASAGAAAAAVSVLVASVAAAVVAAAAAGAAAGVAAPAAASSFLGSAWAAFFSLRFLKAALSLPFRLSKAPNAVRKRSSQHPHCLKPSPSRPLQVGGSRLSPFFSRRGVDRCPRSIPIAPSNLSDRRARKTSTEGRLTNARHICGTELVKAHKAIERGDAGVMCLRATSLCCFNATVGDGSGRRR